jgi:hypothetical protein
MMTPRSFVVRSVFLVTALASGLASGQGAAAAPAVTGAQWQEQKIKFTYDGITTLYTCDGLEDKVREILLLFGARKDVKVRATGCERGSNLPSRFAWVEATYNALMPTAGSEGVVKTVWSPLVLSPNRPNFMGAGECELIDQMRDVLTKGFTLRGVQYRASCTPHSVSIGSYAVTAEALKADKHAE